MKENNKQRNRFSTRLGFILSAAGASVGLGNIWRFPYLAAKYGGGIFLLVYILLALTFGYTMIMAETALGRMTRKSPVGAFRAFGQGRGFRLGGWLNAVIPVLIVSYYSTIGGWVLKYLFEYLRGHADALAQDGYFSAFIASGVSAEGWFLAFAGATLFVIWVGVQNGIERVSKLLMPLLVLLALVIAGYSMTRPGALAGVAYFLIPNLDNFSWMTVVAAMGQMFYSLSIAMGILITFGSYMSDEMSIENATRNVELFDTAISVMAGLMVIPAVFAFSGGSADALNAGPALMFITIPKVFAEMGFGSLIGTLFFLLVFFAALTSAIALAESAVSTVEDELGFSRSRATLAVGVVIVALGSLASLGYGPLAGVTLLGMQLLDFFDFLSNSVMMPLAALATCLLMVYVIGIERATREVEKHGAPFRQRGVFRVMLRYFCPAFILVILFSSVANVLGWITI